MQGKNVERTLFLFQHPKAKGVTPEAPSTPRLVKPSLIPWAPISRCSSSHQAPHPGAGSGYHCPWPVKRTGISLLPSAQLCRRRGSQGWAAPKGACSGRMSPLTPAPAQPRSTAAPGAPAGHALGHRVSEPSGSRHSAHRSKPGLPRAERVQSESPVSWRGERCLLFPLSKLLTEDGKDAKVRILDWILD